MPQSRANYLIVGGFVLVMLAALITTLAVLAGRSGATNVYLTTFPNVAGLKFGTPVFYEGFRAGQIDKITPLTGGAARFAVRLKILAALEIPDDSVARITQPNLLSARAVTIEAGRSHTILKSGDEIRGGAVVGLAALPALVGGGQDLIAQGHELLTQLTTALTVVNDWLEHDFPTVAGDYAALPLSLEDETLALSEQAQALIADVRDVVGRANRILNDDSLDDIQHTLANVERTTTRVEAVSQSLGQLNDNVQAITAELRDFMTDNKPDLETAIVDLRYALERVSLRIDAMTYNLEGTSRNMYEFSREIRLNPGLLIGGTAPEDEAALSE